MNTNCQICGKSFPVRPSQIAKGRGKFCSQKCNGESQKKNLWCAFCGNRVPSGNDKFCSIACRDKMYRTVHSPKWKDGQRVTQTCNTCGRAFEAFRPDVERGMGRFCSRDCYHAWQSGNGHEKHSRASGGHREDLGIYVRSIWEANWARYLNWLIAQGEIVSWEYEPDTFEFSKIKRGTRFYTPDFKVTNKDGSVEYHEVKGYMDQKSRTKLDRMSRYHPEVKVVLVDEACYRAMARQLKRVLPGWETKASARRGGD